MASYTPSALSGMCGLPEQLVAVLLRSPRYKKMNDDEIVDALLALKEHIDDAMDGTLIVSVVSECIASQQEAEVERKLITFAEDMRKNQEHSKLVELTQKKQALEQAQARAESQRAHQPQWRNEEPERPFYTVLPPARVPSSSSAEQSHYANFQQTHQPVQSVNSPPAGDSTSSAPANAKGSHVVQQQSSSASATPRPPTPPPEATTSESHNTSLSGSKSGGGGWFGWLKGGSKNASARQKVTEEEETKTSGRKPPANQQTAESHSLKPQEEEKHRHQENDLPNHRPQAQHTAAPTGHTSSSGAAAIVSPYHLDPAQASSAAPSSTTHMFGVAVREGPDSPSYGIAAIQPRPDLFGSEHLDQPNGNIRGTYHEDPTTTSAVPAGAPIVSFGAPTSGTSTKDSDANFDDVFNSFLSKEKGS